MLNFIKKIFYTPLWKYKLVRQDGEKRIVFFKRAWFKKFVKTLFIIIVLGASVIIIYDYYYYGGDYSESTYYDSQEDLKCNVIGVSIIGDIVTIKVDEKTVETSADDIMYQIGDINNDDEIKAILIEIDSAGGYPVAAEEIAAAIKRSAKPTVALIREYGNSAAYWVASAADIIFASKNTELGSIGVNSSYLDYSEQNQKEGIKYIELTGGKFKAAGDPDRPLSQEERNLLLRDVNILHQNFISAVSENRSLDREAVKALADGSSMLGEMALEKGLIDRLGNYYDVLDYLDELIGEQAEVCWY